MDETDDVCNFATALHKKTGNIAKINDRQNAPYFSIESDKGDRCTESIGTLRTLQRTYSNPIDTSLQ